MPWGVGPRRSTARFLLCFACSSVLQVKDACLLHEPSSRISRHCEFAVRGIPEGYNLKLSFNLSFHCSAFQESDCIGSCYRTVPNGAYFKIYTFDCCVKFTARSAIFP